MQVFGGYSLRRRRITGNDLHPFGENRWSIGIKQPLPFIILYFQNSDFMIGYNSCLFRNRRIHFINFRLYYKKV